MKKIICILFILSILTGCDLLNKQDETEPEPTPVPQPTVNPTQTPASTPLPSLTPGEKTDYLDFTIDGNRFSWEAMSPGFDYMTGSGYYYNIYESDEGSSASLCDEVFIHIASDVPGYYTDADGITRISYYDIEGNSYYDFYSGCYSHITVIEWSCGRISGEISAMLHNSTTDTTINISGSFISFDDSCGSRSFSIQEPDEKSGCDIQHQLLYAEEKMRKNSHE